MTVNYKVIFRNTGNPDDGVTIVPAAAGPTTPTPPTIDVPKGATVYEFDVDGPDSNPQDFTFSLLFNFSPVPSNTKTITNVTQTGKKTTFTAHNEWYLPDFEYFLVAQAQAGAMRGSSLMGRKPIIRTAGAKVSFLLLLSLLLALCLAMLVFIAVSH